MLDFPHPFGHGACNVHVYANILNIYQSFGNLVPYHVVPQVNMIGSFVVDQVGFHEHCSLVVHDDWDGFEHLHEFSQELASRQPVLVGIKYGNRFSLSDGGYHDVLP